MRPYISDFHSWTLFHHRYSNKCVEFHPCLYLGLESSDIDAIFVANGSPKPKCVKMFPSKTERSSSGLIEFETLNDALEGLVVCNHQPIPNPNGKFPYIMKLCFSREAT